jgi:hypothetical protein
MPVIGVDRAWLVEGCACVRRAALCAALVVFVGCGGEASVRQEARVSSPPDVGADAAAVARQRFSEAFSCPDNRIVVTPSGALANNPPPEVAADPERLAIWQKNHASDPSRVFDVTGCNRHVRLSCRVFADDQAMSFCSPVVEPGQRAGRVIVDPAATQQALEQLARADAEGGHRPKLGVAMAYMVGLGLVVGAVLPGGPADGKLRVGDVILEAAGEAITDAGKFNSLIEAHAGGSLELKVRRNGEILAVFVDVRRD